MAIFGFVLACTTSNVGARYFAMCCFATGVYACNSVIIGWIASTCGQTKEKKAAAIGMANTIANLSPIYSPVSLQIYFFDTIVLTRISISGLLGMLLAM